MPKKCLDVNVTVPSPSSLNNTIRLHAKSLTDKQLITKYGQLKAAKKAWVYRTLPSKYFVGIADPYATGKVPKDVMSLVNIDPTIEDFQKEIKKRNICYQLTIDPFK